MNQLRRLPESCNTSELPTKGQLVPFTWRHGPARRWLDAGLGYVQQSRA